MGRGRAWQSLTTAVRTPLAGIGIARAQTPRAVSLVSRVHGGGESRHGRQRARRRGEQDTVRVDWTHGVRPLRRSHR